MRHARCRVLPHHMKGRSGIRPIERQPLDAADNAESVEASGSGGIPKCREHRPGGARGASFARAEIYEEKEPLDAWRRLSGRFDLEFQGVVLNQMCEVRYIGAHFNGRHVAPAVFGAVGK